MNYVSKTRIVIKVLEENKFLKLLSVILGWEKSSKGNIFIKPGDINTRLCKKLEMLTW